MKVVLGIKFRQLHVNHKLQNHYCLIYFYKVSLSIIMDIYIGNIVFAMYCYNYGYKTYLQCLFWSILIIVKVKNVYGN